MSARHAFCLRHQKLLLRVLVPMVAVYVVWLALTDVPQGLLIQGLGLCVAACIYLATFAVMQGRLRVVMFGTAAIAGLVVVAMLPVPVKIRVWLSAMLIVAVVSALRARPDEKLMAIMPKELAASLLFALGCSAGVHLWTPPEHGTFCLEVRWFWALVLINLLVIQWCEQLHERPKEPRSWPVLLLLIGGLTCFSLQALLFEQAAAVRALALVTLMAALADGLLLIMARRLRPDLFHILADLLLLLPLPLLWWWV